MHQLISCNCACSPFHSTIPFHHSIPPFHSTIPFHIPVQQLETPSDCRGCILTQSCTCFCVWQWICLFIDLEYEIHRCSCLNTKQALRMVEERKGVCQCKKRKISNKAELELRRARELHRAHAPCTTQLCMCQPYPQTPPPHEEKWSGEPSQISWARAQFSDHVPSNVQNILCQTSSKRQLPIRLLIPFWYLKVEIRNTLCLEYLCRRFQ